MGPEVVRMLLLEENLKIRERKDSKVSRASVLDYCSSTFSLVAVFLLSHVSSHMVQLEVVALLFSDVLLMTKVQKKGERLKVVRPPLALDRTYCIALKDGCE